MEAAGLVKHYSGRSGDVEAVRGVDLAVRAGEIFGFLGPNGAGKSTTVRMLTTLLTITAGSARVAGVDVIRDPDAARHRMGVALQEAGLDPRQTGRELLVLQGRLFDMSQREAAARAEALLELVELEDAADRRINSYSGGMKRRLDLASALVHEPEVLFLDEPTTGLDPASRLTVWDEVRRINGRGTTVFLTTQYLEEADQLCDRLAIIDDGMIVREGTPSELKAELRERLRAGRRSPRSTTCSSTRPAARAAGAPATCRRCRRDARLGARAARDARGVAHAGGAGADAVHPALLPRGQRRPGRRHLPLGVDGLPRGPGLRRLPAPQLAAAGRLVRHGGAVPGRGHRGRLLRQAAGGADLAHRARHGPAHRRVGQGPADRDGDRGAGAALRHLDRQRPAGLRPARRADGAVGRGLHGLHAAHRAQDAQRGGHELRQPDLLPAALPHAELRAARHAHGRWRSRPRSTR